MIENIFIEGQNKGEKLKKLDQIVIAYKYISSMALKPIIIR